MSSARVSHFWLQGRDVKCWHRKQFDDLRKLRILIRIVRKSSTIDALFPKTRWAILSATMVHPSRWWYLSDLAHHLNRRPSSLQRELSSLVQAGILQKRRDGNRVYFQANPDCPFLAELQGLLIKTVGIKVVIEEALKPLAKNIQWAFIYGSIARSEEWATSDVDLLVIGHVNPVDMAQVLRDAEKHLLREINPTIYSSEEFAQKSQSGHHFVQTVMGGDKLFILGQSDELESFIKQ